MPSRIINAARPLPRNRRRLRHRKPASPAPAQIDNCCYVDRQCTTDLDWMGGWHAYRAGQCGAPGQAQTVMTSQPGSGVLQRTAGGIVVGYISGHRILPSTRPQPSIEAKIGEIVSITFNNCCQYHWQCNDDSDWAAGHRRFQDTSLCTLPRLVSIVGDPDFIQFFTQRLDELKNKLPHRYDYVLNGLTKIEQSRDVLPVLGQVNMHGEFILNWKGPWVDGWEKRMSAALVHEACHVHRWASGHRADACNPQSVMAEEVVCREMELAVVIEPGAPAHVIDGVSGMLARTRQGEGLGMNPPDFC